MLKRALRYLDHAKKITNCKLLVLVRGTNRNLSFPFLIPINTGNRSVRKMYVHGLTSGNERSDKTIKEGISVEEKVDGIWKFELPLPLIALSSGKSQLDPAACRRPWHCMSDSLSVGKEKE